MATNDFSFPVFCEFRFLRQTLKGLGSWRTLSGFNEYFVIHLKVVAALQPWAEISERLRR